MLQSGRVPERLTKRSLVAVSHAIERAALAPAEDGPLVVVALFQRMPYFERESALYQRIAATAAVTVIGMVGPTPPALPQGTYGVLLDAAEPLAREWSVLVLTPRFGAALVAHDRMEVEPTAATLEAGRLFDGGWSFRRDDALHEMVRLRGQLGDRLPRAALLVLDDVLGRTRELPATPGETRGEAAIRLLVRRAERDRVALDTTRRPDDVSAQPATLLDDAAMRRWTGLDGVTASGILPVALVAVRVTEPAEAPERFGRRGAAREAQAVLGALTAPLRPNDRAVRLAEDEYLLVLPSLDEDQAIEVTDRIREGVAGLARSYPFVAFDVHAALTVTARRPLPVTDVRHALSWAVEQGVPLATVALEPAPAPAGVR
ncbi:DICT sensory domain-containing protein [Micromonospora sp. NPDC005324]|uniref:DICT sensory domain-containing protein n=1 Tax=Micromonospora sp. NPDC005324 TaxID=3157033 RepID=UPI0033B01476